ncbi:MAG: hypothetical protein AABZ30_06795 [Myxococcota bacterium]
MRVLASVGLLIAGGCSSRPASWPDDAAAEADGGSAQSGTGPGTARERDDLDETRGSGETPSPSDRPQENRCGDGICAGAEACSTCAEDCPCPGCDGDGECDRPFETCEICQSDCGSCTRSGAAVCGNDACERVGGECESCPADCRGECGAICGDGFCDEKQAERCCGETFCAADCDDCSPCA